MNIKTPDFQNDDRKSSNTRLELTIADRTKTAMPHLIQMIQLGLNDDPYR